MTIAVTKMQEWPTSVWGRRGWDINLRRPLNLEGLGVWENTLYTLGMGRWERSVIPGAPRVAAGGDARRGPFDPSQEVIQAAL